MVKNTTGGNKTKKIKRSFGKYNALEKIEPGQMFAKIIHNNGGSFSVLCSDGIVRLGKLSGEMKKGPRLSEGSYVVISLREFESEQKHCDIIAHGDPPSDIVTILKTDSKPGLKNISKKTNANTDVDFVDSDDEFKEFEESARTTNNNINNTNTNANANTNDNTTNTNNFDWDDL